jgi:Xaa-Pro aminopeptidase
MTTADIAVVDGHPRFSPAEMDRRREALLDAAADRGVERLLVAGVDRSGTAVQWLTGWPVTREAYAIVDASHRDALYVGFYNHVPQARELAADADVAWVGDSAAATVAAELGRRGHRGPLGVIGPVRAPFAAGLADAGIAMTDLGAVYTGLRQIKSAEEVAWLRRGAALSDAGIAALATGLRSGLTEYDLCDLVERAYVPGGGTTHIHYFGVTPMSAPSRANPAQHPSARRVRPGDAVVVELSAAFAGYAGQVLRSFTVEADATPLYRDLHAAAESAYDAIVSALRDGATPDEIIEAASVIEQAGFTTIDDVVHGFGGGYLPPVLGSRSRPAGGDRGGPVRAGMTIVVQPNVVTPDLTAGVQVGELMLVTAHGAERLHTAPRGLARVG